ncbi:polysaccharide deacetylase family protein [Neobacillus notoginsengisoli]|uniref:Polysaccharide deacetylase family protein n=1 Tax=Neobacillus notoginsengisoli TaxID=1578198 RepID=A0A417YS28_9BACI|nr:polysaccharide deacetylase family protein [Neobacillus notoginsengisoli]RHW38091.1 polysaccharide deacetylase family protein [Neobacillus notoginsengisoli]
MAKIFSILIFGLVLLFPSQTYAAKKIPILIYHSIAEYQGSGQKELYVTPENFQKQMEYLKENGFTPLTFEQWGEVDRIPKPIFITVDDGYKNNLNILTTFNRLRDTSFKPAATLFVISDFIGNPNRLSQADLRTLSASRMFSIQSHTATHPDLTKTSNLQHELEGSKLKIEQITGKPVIALSYPYGNTNRKVLEETKKYYQFGLSTTPQVFIQENKLNENFTLPRLYVKYSTTLADFAKIVLGQ